MAYSYAESTASGSTAIFTVPFEYISKAYVHVSVNGVLVDDALLTWNSSTEIVLPTTPAAGATVRRYRTTPKTPLVTFQSGDLSTSDLNLFARQCSHLVQEATDTGDSIEAALLAVSAAIQNAATATVAAQAAVAAVAAALADLAEQDLSDYSTTAQVLALLDDYVPATRTIASGLGVKINGGASSTLGGTVTVGLDMATDAETVAGLLANKPSPPSGVHAAIAAALAGFSMIGIKNVRLITASGNVTPSAGVNKWLAFGVGGGGGSGFSGGAPTGGGGGGGGFLTFSDVSPSSSYPVTIGAAGGAGTGSNNGGNGGTTSLTIGATTYTATGGNGSTWNNTGPSAGQPGTGGTGTNGILNASGQRGSPGPFTTSGSHATGSGGTGAFGLGYGNGGNGSLGSNGSAGIAGCLLILEYGA